MSGSAEHPVWGAPMDGATNELRFARSEAGELLVRKAYRQARHYRQEKAALERWVPRLGFGAPRLLEDLGEDERTLILVGVPGQVPTPEDLLSPRLQATAGAALRALQSLQHEDRDRVAPADAIVIRLDSLLATEGLELEPGWRRAAAACAERIPDLDWPAARVPCHRDFEARNWIVGERGFGLIDFEHARPDIAEVDLVKLDQGLWRDHPELREPFLEAWQPGDRQLLRGRLDVLGFLHALGTFIWGGRQGDRNFEKLGRTMLDRFARKS